MVRIFFAVSCLLALALLAGIFYLLGNKHELSRSIRYLFAMAAVTVMCNAIAVIAANESVSTLFHGLYLAATDWLVITLLFYAQKYTGLFQGHRRVNFIICLLAAADTVSLVLNVHFHHVFHCVIGYNILGGGSCYVVEPNASIYVFHLLYVYAVVIFVAVLLVMKTLQTIKLYRRKYEAVLWSFICILAVNIGYRFIDGLSIDLSSILYMVLAIAIGYFTLFYVPRGIVAKLLSFSIEDMAGGILCFDMDGKCVYANAQARQYFKAGTDLSVMERFFASWRAGEEGRDLKESKWQEKQESDGQTLHYENHYKPLLDSKGNYIGGFFAIEDRTEDVRQLQRERYRATHDALTGLYNREHFYETVRQMLDAAPEEEWYMVCTDIKDFKMVNELFGRKRGNEILEQVAAIIQREASEDTVYCRMVADRFALCIKAKNFNEKVFIDNIHYLGDMTENGVYRMHIHVGVYRITDSSMEVSVMCDRARMAIATIKDNYQQTLAYYDDKIGTQLQNEKTMIGEFDRALEEGQFCMYLQPQVSVGGQDLLGAEALVRWIHPEKGMVSPGEFIPVFEKSGYIPKLDYYVWELACRQLKTWKEQGRGDLHISVNISPKDFYFINIYDVFTKLVERYGIDPENLKLEITETALMTELNQQMDLLEKLRRYGFHIEIDDFGSGYSSLNMLKDIEVDVLKLDMGFLRKSENEEKGITIMNAIIAMSKKLGLTVITEGVETSEQVNYLTDSGCDIFQGFFFDRPMPVTDFENKYFA